VNDASQRSFVVIIGGGYAGINVARALDDHTHVTLVEPKDAFVHNVAAFRALVEPTWVPRIFLPYDHLLTPWRCPTRHHRPTTTWPPTSIGSKNQGHHPTQPSAGSECSPRYSHPTRFTHG